MFSRLLFLLPLAFGAIIDFEVDVGGIADDDDVDTAWKNGGLINKTLAELSPGDTLVFPASTYHVMGGIRAPVGLKDVTIQLDGTLEFSDDIDEWPKVRRVLLLVLLLCQGNRWSVVAFASFPLFVLTHSLPHPTPEREW